MTKFRSAIVAALFTVAAVSAGAALAGTTGSTKIVKFNASYAGTAAVKVTGDIADISATGAGKGTPIGAGKVTGKGTGDAAGRPCNPFTGTGSMTGPKKAKINFKIAPGSQGCGDEAGEVFSITGRAIVTGGAGAYKKAKGNLKLTGIYDQTKGTFAVKFTGKLTLP